MPTTNAATRDYNLISPSAKSLVLLKGLTNIPFARETAALISAPEPYHPDLNKKDAAYWKRVVHFENRYWTVDQLLSPLGITNILELCSGYSFRGLATVQEKAVHYKDTDLEEVVEQKKLLIQALQKNEGNQPKGQLELLPLNALDEEAFLAIANSFPPGPIAIVNEGLMMYLGDTEKEKLCRIIHKVLDRRGGVWITGDIYVKATLERLNDDTEDALKELLQQQRIEDNMFESFDVAATFLKRAGFSFEQEAALDHTKLSSLQYLVNNCTPEQLAAMREEPRIQATWMLKAIPGN